MVAHLAALPGDDPTLAAGSCPRPLTHDLLGAPAPGEDGAPVWFVFRVTLPDAAARAATWRALRDLDALNVQRGLWAVRGDPAHRHRLDALTAQISEAGGRATLDEIGIATSEQVVLTSRLHRACERLWEPFANQADWYEVRVARGEWAFAERVAALTGLVEQFAGAISLDIARSQASRTAEDRLDRLAAALLREPGTDPERWCRRQPAVCGRVALLTSFPLVDGRRAYVAGVTPLVDPLRELAFARFEAFAYRPSPSRIPLRAGTFRWCAAPGAENEVLSAVSERVARFEASVR